MLAGSVSWGAAAHVPTHRPSSPRAPAPVRATRARARMRGGRGREVRFLIGELPTLATVRVPGVLDLDVAVGERQERRPVRAGGVAAPVLAPGEVAVGQPGLDLGE